MKTSYPQEDMEFINNGISEFDLSASDANVNNINNAEKTPACIHQGNNTEKNEEKKQINNNQKVLNFTPGARLEVKDFSEKWYAARIVETDYVEREVLIHFEKWSASFDEWISMDSCRLRAAQAQPKLRVVLPKSVQPRIPVETVFDKKHAIASNAISTDFEEIPRIPPLPEVQKPWTPPPPEPSKTKEFVVGERVLATWGDGRKYPAHISSVLANGRYDVLFDDGYAKVIKASKIVKMSGTADKYLVNDYIGSKQERRDKKRKHSVMELFNKHAKKKPPPVTERLKKEDEKNGQETMNIQVKEKTSAFNTMAENNVNRNSQNLESIKQEELNYDLDYDEEIGTRWINGEPQGIEAFIQEGSDGRSPRRSIIVYDKRLPPGWQRHFTQRRTGCSAGKWDVFFVHEKSVKKFRSKSEIKMYLDSMGDFDYDMGQFDFCARRKRKVAPFSKMKNNSEMKKNQTFMPKNNSSGFHGATGLTPEFSHADDNAVFIGTLRVEIENSAYKCPKEGCHKQFRKENLLQMHIKHYHPEYSKFLGSTPNVADLAYARTIGESVDGITPKKHSYFSDRPKLDRRKEKTPLAPVLSPMMNQMPPVIRDSSILPPVLEAEGTKKDLKESFVDSSIRMGIENDPGHFETEPLSPNTAFHKKMSKGEKAFSGLRTLFPVRHEDKAKTEEKKKTFFERENPKQEKWQDTLDYELADDDSTLDTDKSSFSYRFSKMKNSPLIENRFDKVTALKGTDSDKKTDNDIEEKEGPSTMMINGELVKLERLRREEIINCTCRIMEEDGLMIQCDVCLCWQHAYCSGVDSESQVPDKYICSICQNSYRQRPSKKYAHDQEWIKEGKLPSLPGRAKNQQKMNLRTAVLKRCFDLVNALLQIQEVLHSLRVKINVAKEKDHPKLYLWAKNWPKIGIPKVDTEPVPVMKYERSKNFKNGFSQNDELLFDAVNSRNGFEKTITSNSELMTILEGDNALLENPFFHSNNENDMDVLMKDDTTQDTQTGNGSSNQSSFHMNFANEQAHAPPRPVAPEPEAPIDPMECRIRLLEHIRDVQIHIDLRLNSIETQITYLEEGGDYTEPSDQGLLRNKQTVQMLLRDLLTIRKLAASF